MASRSLTLPFIDSADLFERCSDDGASCGIKAGGDGGSEIGTRLVEWEGVFICVALSCENRSANKPYLCCASAPRCASSAPSCAFSLGSISSVAASTAGTTHVTPCSSTSSSKADESASCRTDPRQWGSEHANSRRVKTMHADEKMQSGEDGVGGGGGREEGGGCNGG